MKNTKVAESDFAVPLVRTAGLRLGEQPPAYVEFCPTFSQLKKAINVCRNTIPVENRFFETAKLLNRHAPAQHKYYESGPHWSSKNYNKIVALALRITRRMMK